MNPHVEMVVFLVLVFAANCCARGITVDRKWLLPALSPPRLAVVAACVASCGKLVSTRAHANTHTHTHSHPTKYFEMYERW